nr:type I restriction-modification system subunit M N-terminal domain-containing protein [Desulfogranum japonicum]
MKRLDDLDLKQVQDAEWTKEPFTSRFDGFWIPPEHRDKGEKDQEPFKIEKRSLRWSEFKRMQAEEMLQHVQNRVFPFLKDLNGDEASFTALGSYRSCKTQRHNILSFTKCHYRN